MLCSGEAHKVSVVDTFSVPTLDCDIRAHGDEVAADKMRAVVGADMFPSGSYLKLHTDGLAVDMFLAVGMMDDEGHMHPGPMMENGEKVLDNAVGDWDTAGTVAVVGVADKVVAHRKELLLVPQDMDLQVVGQDDN